MYCINIPCNYKFLTGIYWIFRCVHVQGVSKIMILYSVSPQRRIPYRNVFNSPELKVQVSFSGNFYFGVHMSICPSLSL